MKDKVKIIIVVIIIIVFFSFFISKFLDENITIETDNINYFDVTLYNIIDILKDRIDIDKDTMVTDFGINYDSSGKITRLYLDIYNKDYSNESTTNYTIRYSNNLFKIIKKDKKNSDFYYIESHHIYLNTAINLIEKVNLRDLTKKSNHDSYMIMFMGYGSFATGSKIIYKVTEDYRIEKLDKKETSIKGIGVVLFYKDKNNENTETQEINGEQAIISEYITKEKEWFIYLGYK